jgi:hypothetical protein
MALKRQDDAEVPCGKVPKWEGAHCNVHQASQCNGPFVMCTAGRASAHCNGPTGRAQTRGKDRSIGIGLYREQCVVHSSL